MESIVKRLFPGEDYGLFMAAIKANMPAEGCLLDLGCGDNRLLAPWRNGTRQVWGADFQAHPQLAHVDWFRLLQADGGIPFPDASFDLITSQWVLEHVTQPESFLNEVARVLRPDGAFVSLTVNAKHYVSWMARLLHLAPHAWTQKLIYWLLGRAEEDTFPTHYRMNSLAQLRRAIRNTGLELHSSRFYASPEYFGFSSVLYSLAALVDRVLEGVWPSLGSIYWVVVLEKRPFAASRHSALSQRAA
jgi:SAM-dependent methyltransferase